MRSFTTRAIRRTAMGVVVIATLLGIPGYASPADAAVPTNNVFPIIDRDASVCADNWGDPRDGGTRIHKGDDCSAPTGTLLLAVESGTVTTGVEDLGGITIRLRGDSGTGYYYAHNSENLVGKGARVARGQAIAKVGETGNATGPHLHFGLYPTGFGGAPVDPHPFLVQWTTVHSSPTPPPKTHLMWMQRDSLSGGNATHWFVYGVVGDLPLVGDWDGNGTETPGLWRPSTAEFLLKNTNTGGNADKTFRFGAPGVGHWPIVGDWDGNGTDNVGVFDLNTARWYLDNGNNGGTADITFVYGTQGDLPIPGDWNNDGKATAGVLRAGNRWLLRNSNSGGAAELNISYGTSGDVPVVGDWNDSGGETPGVVRGANWLLRNDFLGGNAQISFIYGTPGDTFTPADWNGDGQLQSGIVRAI